MNPRTPEARCSCAQIWRLSAYKRAERGEEGEEEDNLRQLMMIQTEIETGSSICSCKGTKVCRRWTGWESIYMRKSKILKNRKLIQAPAINIKSLQRFYCFCVKKILDFNCILETREAFSTVLFRFCASKILDFNCISETREAFSTVFFFRIKKPRFQLHFGNTRSVFHCSFFIFWLLFCAFKQISNRIFDLPPKTSISTAFRKHAKRFPLSLFLFFGSCFVLLCYSTMIDNDLSSVRFTQRRGAGNH